MTAGSGVGASVMARWMCYVRQSSARSVGEALVSSDMSLSTVIVMKVFCDFLLI